MREIVLTADRAINGISGKRGERLAVDDGTANALIAAGAALPAPDEAPASAPQNRAIKADQKKA